MIDGHGDFAPNAYEVDRSGVAKLSPEFLEGLGKLLKASELDMIGSREVGNFKMVLEEVEGV